MTDRSATATIKGYHYQFDKTILEILKLDDEGYVTVEGLEDVDVRTSAGTTAIQCKYYAAQKYSPSVVRDAVTAMLDDFVTRNSTSKPYVDYFLYGYFKDASNLPATLDLSYLQKMLRWTTRGETPKARDYQEEHNISDKQLTTFLQYFRMESADDFEQQRESVMKAVEKAYKCSREEAELHFYSNALHKVITLASKPGVEERVVSQAQFISATNQARTLFNVWFLKWRGKEAYLKVLKKRLKDCNTLYGLNDKWLFLDAANVPFDSPEFSLVSLIEKLIEDYYKLGSTHYTHKPWTLVTTQSAKDLLVVKQHLIRRGIRFFDGMESIEFSTAFFRESPVFSTKGQNGKIDRASHQIRILSAETLETHRDILEPAPNVVLFVSRDLDPAELFGVRQGMQIHHLTYVDELTDLATLI